MYIWPCGNCTEETVHQPVATNEEALSATHVDSWCKSVALGDLKTAGLLYGGRSQWYKFVSEFTSWRVMSRN